MWHFQVYHISAVGTNKRLFTSPVVKSGSYLALRWTNYLTWIYQCLPISTCVNSDKMCSNSLRTNTTCYVWLHSDLSSYSPSLAVPINSSSIARTWSCADMVKGYFDCVPPINRGFSCCVLLTSTKENGCCWRK